MVSCSYPSQTMGNPLSDLGLIDSGRVQVDHKILASTALDVALCRVLNVLSDATRDTAKAINNTLNIVGCAAACYLVLSGLSKIVEASRSNKKINR